MGVSTREETVFAWEGRQIRDKKKRCRPALRKMDDDDIHDDDF